MIRVYYKRNVKGENKLFKRNKTLAGILAIFLGTLGIHKFYQGKWKAGIAYFLFFWTGIPTILGILDGAKLLTEVADEVPDESAPAKKEKAVNIENKKDANKDNKDNTEKSTKLDKVAKSENSTKLDKTETVKETGKTEKTEKSDETNKSEKSENQTKSKAENKTEDKTENKVEKKSENKPEKRNMKSRLSDLRNHDDSEEDDKDDFDDDTEE